MEERIIDDEYGRGIRLKKTKDGYVDVTDELAEKDEEGQEVDEMSFEFPMFDGEEDDEDLVGLSPEEAAALRKQKAEAAEKRRAEYEQACAEAEELLGAEDYDGAEKKFEEALLLDGIATVASVGYWRAKTKNFSDPDVLISEYADSGLESLEYDLGLDATDIIKRDYKESFERRVAELSEEEAPLTEIVEGKQSNRRSVLMSRLGVWTTVFGVCLLATVALIVLTVVFGLKIPTTRDNEHIPHTIVFGVLSLIMFVVLLVFTKKFLDAVRMNLRNERLSSTEEGERLETIRAYKSLYLSLLEVSEEPAEEESKE